MINNLVNGMSKMNTQSQEVAQDIVFLQFTIVNACIIGQPRAKSGSWILVDTGLESSYDYIIEVAEKRFGKESKPAAIILTHGHFDHVGSVKKLADKWDVPVFAHSVEMPYITGKKDYPQADPTVDEGMVAKISPAFPHKAIDLGMRAAKLPSDGSVPGLSDWKWIHTPGHTEGHISLYREKDRVLIVGDAFTTTKQESLGSVLKQDENVKGPPAYLTTNWKVAKDSVEKLRKLNPDLILPSHGKPMKGDEVNRHLDMLVSDFEEQAVPNRGKYVKSYYKKIQHINSPYKEY